MSYTDSRYGKQHGVAHRGGGGIGLFPAFICALLGLVAYGAYSFAIYSVPSTTLVDMAVKQTLPSAVEHKVFDVNNYPLSAPLQTHSQQDTQTRTGTSVGFSTPAITTGTTATASTETPGLYPQIHPNQVVNNPLAASQGTRVSPISALSVPDSTATMQQQHEYVPPQLGVLYGGNDPAEAEEEEGDSQDGTARTEHRTSSQQNTERRSEYGKVIDADTTAEDHEEGDSRDSGNYHRDGTEEKKGEDSQDFRDSHEGISAANTKDKNAYTPESDRESDPYHGTAPLGGVKDPNAVDADVDSHELRDSEQEHPLFSSEHTGLPPQIQELEDAHHLSQGLDALVVGEDAIADLKSNSENQTMIATANNTANDDATHGTATATIGTATETPPLPALTGNDSSALDDEPPPDNTSIMGSARDDGSTPGDVTPLTRIKAAAFGAAAAAAADTETPVFFSSPPYNASSSTEIATDDSSTTLVGKNESASGNATTAMNVSSASIINANASAISEDSLLSAFRNTTAVGTHGNTTWHSTANDTAGNSSHAQDLKSDSKSHSNMTDSPLAHNTKSSSNATEHSNLPGKHKNSTTGTVLLDSNTTNTTQQTHNTSHAFQRLAHDNNTTTNSTSTKKKSKNGKPKLRGTKPIRIPDSNVSSTALQQ
jgi:hypothetical protein